MILGIGSDLCDIRRIETTLERFGARFTDRIFTQAERQRSERRPGQRAASYAKRFAAKEACAKALGTGFRRGVFFADLGVINLPSGKPTMALAGAAKSVLMELVPKGHDVVVHVSLTDEYPYAYAHVIIEAVPHETV